MTSAQPLVVCHVVGGRENVGGARAFVRTIAASDTNSSIRHVIWVQRDFSASDHTLNYVREGHATATDEGIPQDLLGALRDVLPLFRWVRRQPKVILHAQTRLGMLAAAAVGAWRRCPLVIHLHGLPKRPGLYQLLRRVGGGTFIFNSHKTCRYFGYDPRASDIVLPPIAWPVKPAPTGTGDPRFVAASLFQAGKNLHLIADAFRLLKKQHPSARLNIYGVTYGAPERAYVQLMRQRAAQVPGLQLLDYDPHWLDHLRQEDIFIHAAEVEGFGIVMLEALALGCRLVMPHGTFVDDLSLPYRDQGVFRADGVNARALAEAMDRAATTKFQRDELWQSRLALKEMFSSEAACHQLHAIYLRQIVVAQ